MGGWVGGWLIIYLYICIYRCVGGFGWIEENEAVRMSYRGLGLGVWVGWNV